MTPAIVFDLDGTLVETAPDLHLVLSEVMAENGMTAPALDQVRSMVGDGALALLKRALEAVDAPQGPDELQRLYARFLDIYTASPCRLSHLYPGVEAVLDELTAAGWRLGVCTNKPQAPSEGLLKALGVARFFAAIVGGDALPVRKPDPVHLAATIARMGGEQRAAIMVGDSRNDLLSASNLGIPCLLVSFGYTAIPAVELGADGVVDDFAALPAALRKLLSSPAPAA